MNWILPFIPPHRTFVDVFGGGGGISFAKGPSEVNIYNDVGNVALFFQVLQEYGDDVYRRLYFSPYDRAFFYWACSQLDEMDAPQLLKITNDKDELVKWASLWYISLSQSFRHEEDDNSWLVAKEVNAAANYATHVDDFPQIIDRLRREFIIENKDFSDIFDLYDSRDTLFVCDPPYLPETWDADKGGYKNNMSYERHEEMLQKVLKLEGQVIVCGYPSELYDRYLKRWRKATKVRKGGIKNSSQVARDRTETLWMRVHNEGLWIPTNERKSQTDVSGVYSERHPFEALASFRERNNL